MSIADVPWLPLALALIYLAAAACIYRILMTYRVAQGAIAWILALIGLPYVAVPMFLLFGRNRFGGYIRARRTGDAALTELLNHFEQQTAAVSKRDDEHVPDELQVLCKLGRQPFTTGNRCDLLKNGEATFEALFDAMENARHYILLEFYIVRSDKVGQRIKSILKRKLAQERRSGLVPL